jgi:hypothetical protein
LLVLLNEHHASIWEGHPFLELDADLVHANLERGAQHGDLSPLFFIVGSFFSQIGFGSLATLLVVLNQLFHLLLGEQGLRLVLDLVVHNLDPLVQTLNGL